MAEADWHREMLADRQRVRAFGRAVQRGVRPGDVVLDLGTGSGLLAFLAVKAGAERVYAVDRGQIIEVAEQVALVNGLEERVVFVRGKSTEVELPEKVDLIISETIGSFGLEERILESIDDGRTRFLKPGGRILPDRLDLFVAPSEEVVSPRGWLGELETDWGLDFSPVEELSQHVTERLWADPEKLLGPGARLLSCDLYERGPHGVRGLAETVIEREGELTGWVGWFEAFYGGESILSTAPPIRGSSWKNTHFPIGEPVRVKRGDRVGLSMGLDNPLWSWRFALEEPPVERQMGDFFTYPETIFWGKEGEE